jgi:hypothetical protein
VVDPRRGRDGLDRARPISLECRARRQPRSLAKARAEYRHGYVPLPGLAGARAGYGWIVGTSPRRTKVVLIGGETDYGFTADFRRFVDEHTTIVTLSATDRATAGRVAGPVERAYFAKA